MAVQTKIVITHDKEVNQDINSANTPMGMLLPTYKSKQEALVIANFMQALAMGARNGQFDVQVDGGASVAASGTVTFSSLANNDTVTVAGQVFTAKTSGASGANQFNLGANDTDAATNFAAAVNAHTSLTGVVSAAPAAAITTITSSVKGLIGNSIGIAISAHGSVSAAYLAGGVAETANAYKFGV